MQNAIQNLPSILQLSLARISRNIEVKRENRPRTFFEPCLESIFAQDEEQQTAFLVLTKEDDFTSTGFKKTVFKALCLISSGSPSRQGRKSSGMS